MAASCKVLNIKRPVVDSFDANGDWQDSALADHLLVEVDVFSNGVQIETLQIDFADHAGLEAEYVAGTVTTILSPAIQTAVDAVTFPDPHLSTAQRALITVEYPQSA